MSQENKPLTPEEKNKIALSYFKGSRKGFISWIIPAGALPLESGHPLKDWEKKRRKKNA